MIRIETKEVPTRSIQNSLVGVGSDRPTSWGNYFWIKDGEQEIRVLNMWMENLQHAAKEFLGGGLVRARVYYVDGAAWCLIDDPRIPATYYYNKLCFTGTRRPPVEVAQDAYAYLGDPHGEVEQFTNPKAYWEKRGYTYNEEKGIISRGVSQ